MIPIRKATRPSKSKTKQKYSDDSTRCEWIRNIAVYGLVFSDMCQGLIDKMLHTHKLAKQAVKARRSFLGNKYALSRHSPIELSTLAKNEGAYYYDDNQCPQRILFLSYSLFSCNFFGMGFLGLFLNSSISLTSAQPV